MQQKINGYTREEAEELVRCLAEGRRAGRTLTRNCLRKLRKGARQGGRQRAQLLL